MFDENLIKKARYYFAAVFTESARIRIYITSWDYAQEYTIYNNKQLLDFIAEWESGIIEAWKDIFTVPEMIENNLLIA